MVSVLMCNFEFSQQKILSAGVSNCYYQGLLLDTCACDQFVRSFFVQSRISRNELQVFYLEL